MSITEFLRARYGERRALALAATAGPWRAEAFVYGSEMDGWGTYHPWEIKAADAEVVGHQPYEGGGVAEEGDARHIEAWGPDVVLADLDAKLAIVARHERCGSMVGYCDDGGHGWDDVEGGGCGDLGDLALPFAAHPDYDERWRP